MEPGRTPVCGGPLCPARHLLQLPQATSHKVLVLRLVRAARAQPAAVMPLLVVALQQEQASDWQKVAAYRSLRAMLEHGLQVEAVQDFILVASEQLRASPAQAPRELRLAASNALATLARGHFNPVMTALQRQLKPFGQPDEFTLLTLGKMAASNVYDCIPFLGITLTTMQTVTRWIKDSRRRRALCTALEQMCSAIQVYLHSWERSSYPRISNQQFSAYLFPLYASLTHSWLPESDVQVKLAVLRVLSPILNILLPRTEFQAQIQEDIPLFLGQFQSVATEAFRVTEILGLILEASLVSKKPIPRRHVEPIAGALTRQVCPEGRRRPPTCCRREEVAPIFLCLARLHPAGLMEFFREELTGSQEDAARVELLVLLCQIIGAHLPELWSRRRLCLRALKVVLGDLSAKVRLVTLQAIGRLLEAGYLEEVEGWPLSYVSLQLAVSAHRLSHPVLQLPLGGLEEKAVEAASLEVLQAAVALGKGTSQELWTKTLRLLMQPHYTGSAVPLCHILRLLAEQRRKWVAQGQGGLEPVDSPRAAELLARLLGLAVSPFEGAGRGAAALLLLQALHAEIYRDVAEDWQVEVSTLLQHLEGCSQYTLERTVWAEQLLEFLKRSLQKSRKAGWSLALAQELSTQRSLYPGSSLEREFLYKAWGTALSSAGDAGGVVLQLQDLLLHTDYTDRAQCQGACWGLTYCAEGQLPAALKALRSLEREIFEGEGLARRPPGQGPPQPGTAGARSALLLLYGGLALRAPWEQLRPRLGGAIVARVLRHYDALRSAPQAALDAELALRFCRCASELSRSVPGGRGAAFGLPHKPALLDRLLDLVAAEPLDAPASPVRQEAMTALLHLSAVPARLSRQERREVAQTCLSRVLALPPPEPSGAAAQALRAAALSALAGLLENLLEEEEEGAPAAATWCQELFQLLSSWLASAREWERARALDLSLHLLQSRQRSGSLPRSPCSQFHRLAGVLGPLTGDMLGTIRQRAAHCIGLLLRSFQAPACGNLEWKLHRIQQGLQSERAREVHAASSQLGKVIVRALPSQEVLPFLCALLERLRTASIACGPTALLWFEVAVQVQGPELQDKVPILVATACSCLQPSEDPAQHLLLARAVSVLAQHHHRLVCASLLDQPLLQHRTRRDLWAALATHKTRASARGAPTLKLLLAWASAEEASARRPSRVAALAALREVIWGLVSCDRLLPLLAEVGHTLLVQLGEEAPGTEEPRPASVLDGGPGIGLGVLGRVAAAVLQALFSKALPEVAQELDAGGTWDLLAQPGNCLKGVTLLARALVHCDSPLLDGLLCGLLPALHSPSSAHRNISLVFCMELTGHPLLQKPQRRGLLLQRLLAAAHTDDASLRALVMCGLGSVAEGAPQEVKKQRRALLTALLRGAGDAANPEVACESLQTLRKVWGHLGRPRDLRAVSAQARAHFRHADDSLRLTAFELFGQLAETVAQKQGQAWAREAREALAPLLLHFCDPSPAVAKACRAAFLACAPFLGLQDLVGSVDVALGTELFDAQHSRLLGRVCHQLAHTDPALLEALIVGMPSYTRCVWGRIRLAACRLSGLLLEERGVPCLGQLDLDPLLQSLHSLRGDPCPAVGRAASQVLQIAQQRREEASGSLATGRQGRSLLPGWFFGWWRQSGPVAGRPGPPEEEAL